MRNRRWRVARPPSSSEARGDNLADYPLLVFAISLLALWLSARSGAAVARRWQILGEEARPDFGVILGATLTLLALIIGFSFSMAINRYDQRKNYEEAEANAIGTEYLRADLLPAADAAKVRTLLKSYLDQRVLFYTTRNAHQLRQIHADTAKLQADLWSAVQASAAERPAPLVILAVAGMNDVLNAQGYTQAAWWNRIPIAAWCFMAAIAIGCNLMVGYGTQKVKAEFTLLLVLPLLVSVSFFLIADIDSPRGGAIHVNPQNLVSLAQSLTAH